MMSLPAARWPRIPRHTSPMSYVSRIWKEIRRTGQLSGGVWWWLNSRWAVMLAQRPTATPAPPQRGDV